MKIGSAVVLFFLTTGLLAQVERKEYDLNALTDEIFPLQDQDLNYEDLYENLMQRMASPLDLNTATIEELRSLFVLNENQVQELIQHRARSSILSIYELQALPSFDLPSLQRLQPFVRVDANVSRENLVQRIRKEENNYLILRYDRTLENKVGFNTEDSSKQYLGSPERVYTRFRTSRPNDFSIGFTGEKDAGERFLVSKTQPGFDFISGHLQLFNLGKIANVIIGDYQAQFGQGLILGGGFGMGKGAETISTLRRSNLGLSPYTSVVESGFFRGGAITANPIKKVFISAFGSRSKRDGSVRGDSSEFVSALLMSGFHRTQNELASRKQWNEWNLGSVLEYRSANLQMGSIFHHTQYEVPLMRNQNLYNQFAFQGNRNQNAGFFANYTWNNFIFFGEAAHTIRQGSALIAGVLSSLSAKIDMSLLARSYARNYYGLYANAVAENTSPQNEKGVYWGIKYTHSKKVLFTSYVDLFQFPWLRYRGYAPSAGSEWLLRITYRASKSISVFVQMREESKIRNTSLETTTYQTQNAVKRNWWMNVDYKTGMLNFKTRIQYSTDRLIGQTKGFALIQDASLDVGKFSLTTRYALFDTDDFENRQYVNERDVWLAYSLPAYFGTGSRSYIVAQYQVTKHFTLSGRWARTTYLNEEINGSGSEQIDGNRKTDIKFQARIRF